MWRLSGGKDRERFSLTFYTLILKSGLCNDGIVEPGFWIRIYFSVMVSLMPTNKLNVFPYSPQHLK